MTPPAPVLARATCERLPLRDESVALIFTDPPYLREYLPCYGWLAREAMRVLVPGGFVLAMCGGTWLNAIFRMFDDAGLRYFWKHEIEMSGKRTGVVWRNLGSNLRVPVTVRLKSVLAYSKGRGVPRCNVLDLVGTSGADKRFHHWGQDLESARYLVDCYSRPGDLVLDPFVGGGTTAVACALIGRRCVALDLDPVALATTQDRLASAGIVSPLPMFAGIAAQP